MLFIKNINFFDHFRVYSKTRSGTSISQGFKKVFFLIIFKFTFDYFVMFINLLLFLLYFYKFD